MPTNKDRQTSTYLSATDRTEIGYRAAELGLTTSRYIEKVLNGEIQVDRSLSETARSRDAERRLAIREADSERKYERRGGARNYKPAPAVMLRGMGNRHGAVVPEPIHRWISDHSRTGGMRLPWYWLDAAGRRYAKRTVTTEGGSGAGALQFKVTKGLKWLTDYEPVAYAFDWIFGQDYGYAQVPTVQGGSMRPQPASVAEGGTLPSADISFRHGPRNFHRSVASITVDSPGSGYRYEPTVTISGGGGYGATAYAEISFADEDAEKAGNGTVSAIHVGLAGRGYTTAPTVTISGGDGTGATATAVLTTTDAVIQEPFRLPPQPVAVTWEISGGLWAAMSDEAKEDFFNTGIRQLVEEKVVSEIMYGNASDDVYWNYNINLGAAAGTGLNEFPGTDVTFGGTVNRNTLVDANKMLNDVKANRSRMLICSTTLANALEKLPTTGDGSGTFVAENGMAAGVPYAHTALIEDDGSGADSHVGFLVPRDNIVVVVWNDGVSFNMFSPPGSDVIRFSATMYANCYIHHPANIIRLRLGTA